jgi:hypothetical protein
MPKAYQIALGTRLRDPATITTRHKDAKLGLGDPGCAFSSLRSKQSDAHDRINKKGRFGDSERGQSG